MMHDDFGYGGKQITLKLIKHAILLFDLIELKVQNFTFGAHAGQHEFAGSTNAVTHQKIAYIFK